MYFNLEKHKKSAPIDGINLSRLYGFMFLFLTGLLLIPDSSAFALGIDVAAGVDDVAENIVKSTEKLPSAITAFAYIIAMFFGATGLLKLRNHVENPAQTPLSAALARFAIGGALFSLPIVYEVMLGLITGGNENAFSYDDAFSASDFMSSIFGKLSNIMGDIGVTRDLNAVFGMMLESFSNLPSFLTTLAYMIGLYLGFVGLLHLKNHIEDPDRNPLKEALIRFFIGALLLGLPTVYTVMANTISGEGTDVLGALASLVDSNGFLESAYDSGEFGCTQDILSGMIDSMTFGLAGQTGTASLGTSICQLYGHAVAFPAFLTAISKLIGLYFGFMAVIKLRDHLMNPAQTPVSQALSRFAAGGAFLSMNSIISVVRSTVTPAASQVDNLASNFGAADSFGNTVSGYNAEVGSCSQAADWSVGQVIQNAAQNLGFGGGAAEDATATGTAMGKTVYCAVSDIMSPLHSALTFFTFCAGLIFLMIGISRLLKSEQDGARGPAGLGTFFTFVTAGILISFNDFVRVITMNIFTQGTTSTYLELADTAGMTAAELGEFYAVLSAIVKFMIIIGLISFARGVFIIRNVAEGNGQASLMAGVTHIIGGTLAVNIGPFIHLVQETLGISDYGLKLS